MELHDVKIDVQDKKDLEASLKSYLEKYLEEGEQKTGTYVIGVSGGSMVNLLADVLPQIDQDWKNVRFVMCDERLVPETSADSTHGQYYQKLIPKLGGLITKNNFIVPDLSLPGLACAEDYAEKIGIADLVLLGMGPDGHTCSLFPNHILLQSKKMVDYICNSPKPPPSRITMTLACLRQVNRVVFIATGANKIPIVKEILARTPAANKFPAGQVRSKSGKIVWFVDEDV